MKKLILAFTLAISLVACNNHPEFDAQTLASLKPCSDMGFELNQCMAAYQYAGRPADNNWLGTVAAFAAGAAVNHWWNKPNYQSYAYRPDYFNSPTYWNDNYSRPNRTTVINNYHINQDSIRNQDIYSKPTAPVQVKESPKVVNNGKGTPLFEGGNMQKNLAGSPNTSSTNLVAKPIIETPKSIDISGFKPIQVTKPVVDIPRPVIEKPAFKPIQTRPSLSAPVSKPAFKPIQTRPSSSSISKRK